MPRVRLKELFVEVQGTLYDVVLKKSPQGKIIVTAKPDMSNVKWSAAQKTQRDKMRKANRYAKAALADPQVGPIYLTRAAKEHRVPYNVAVSDYFKGKNLLKKRTGPHRP